MTRRRTCKGILFLFLLSVITMKHFIVQAATLAPHLYKTTFANGLTAIIKETPGTKVATVQIWVKTGSVYEEPSEAGITHLIEHMIFKGTPTRGMGMVAKDIEEKGGRINAYTSYEYTVYHATLSARHWDTALDVLTDAVLHSLFDPAELEKEKKVVLEEIGMRQDKPEIKLYQELMAQAYKVHPYRLPIIGTIDSVSKFTRDDIVKYMAKHYRTENLTVVVVGDVQAEPVEKQIISLFKDVPPAGHGQPKLPVEPPRTEPAFFSLQGDVKQSQLAMAIPIIDFNHPDMPALDVIAAILGDGETSRLYHRLRDELGLVYRVDASAFVPRDPGLFEVSASLDAAKVPAAIKASLEEIFKLKYLPASDEELARVKRKVESDFVFNLERVEGQARVAGSFDFLTNDPREEKYLERVRNVSREEIRRVAEKYFSRDRIIAGVHIPKGADSGMTPEILARIIKEADEAVRTARQEIVETAVKNTYLPDVHSFVLPNGIKLLVREDKTVATVGVHAVFPGGLMGETEATNGAFAFVSDLLTKGTKTMSARDLALRIADMAGNIKGFNGKNTFGLRADFLAQTFEEGLTLCRDILLTPAFDGEEAEKIRAELLDQLRHQEDSLSSVAFREFNRLLFKTHPYGLNVAGKEEVVKNLTTEELGKIYWQHTRPGNMVLAVAGKVEAAKVRDLVSRLFGTWQSTGDAAVTTERILPSVPMPPGILSLPRDKEQVHVIIGFLGTSLKSEDRYPLELLDTILSGQSGRLFTELRDKRSLAYSLSSFSLVGLDTGSVGVYIGTSPEKKDSAIQALWQQIFRIRQEPVSEEELQKAKNVIIGNYELGLQTHSAQALEMALNETYGLGLDYGNRYIEAISKVTADAVLKAANQYLLPEHYVLVAVGPDSR